MKECFKCGQQPGKDGFARALVRVYSREKTDEEIKDGKIDPTYSLDDRWVCLECLFTKIGSSAFEQGLDYAPVGDYQ